MAAVSLRNIVKSYAGRLVLDDITLDLHKGEKVGLIGANGSGKTTLFKIVAGMEPPDSGSVTRARDLNIAYLPQTPDMVDTDRLIDVASAPFETHRELEAELQALATRIAETTGAPEEATLLERYDRLHARFESLGGYSYEIRIREVLGGLGFAPMEYDRPVGMLSGGQRCRAALARLLLAEGDLLLLDEPTNHLDIDATRWLETYLANYAGGAVIVSHDRYLLDRVVSKIIEIEDHHATVFPTDYTGYAETKRVRQLAAERAHAKQRAWIAHQEDYIRRAGHRKDTARQARSRRKLLDNMKGRGDILKQPRRSDATPKLRFQSHGKAGDMVLRCEAVHKGFGEIQLLHDLDFEMTVGEKVGIIGPNGVGKTTLLRLFVGELEPDAGSIRRYENLTVGYYDQEHRTLDPTLSVLEALREVRPEAAEAEVRSYLAMFLFRGDDVFKRVGTLSGGEQSRVLLARLIRACPQVLVLDEPTNHLDIPAREALEAALRRYTGSILMVSHDRYFLDRIAGRLLVLPRRNQHEIIDGNWSTYAEILARREAEQRTEAMRAAEARRRDRAARPGGGRRKKTRSKYARQRIEEIEAAILQKEARIKEIETAFADPAFMKGSDRLGALHSEYDDLRADLSELNRRWETAVDAQED